MEGRQEGQGAENVTVGPGEDFAGVLVFPRFGEEVLQRGLVMGWSEGRDERSDDRIPLLHNN